VSLQESYKIKGAIQTLGKVINMTEKNMLNFLKEKMEGAINAFNTSINTLRIGRATPCLVDSIKVEAYNDSITINQIASITSPDSKTILIQVWDKKLVTSVEKAILTSGLGITPMVEEQYIRLNIPPLTENRRKELIKKANEYKEDSKIAIRNIRRTGMDYFKKLEKEHLISRDVLQKYNQDIQTITNEYTTKIDEIFDRKSRDIMTI